MRPANDFWSQRLVASRLTLYEVIGRLNAVAAVSSVRDEAFASLDSFDLVELPQTVLERAPEPFSKRVRTLDALDLATACHRRICDADLRVATFDRRVADVAASIGLPLVPWPR